MSFDRNTHEKRLPQEIFKTNDLKLLCMLRIFQNVTNNSCIANHLNKIEIATQYL
jgi:hypothetical protein